MKMAACNTPFAFRNPIRSTEEAVSRHKINAPPGQNRQGVAVTGGSVLMAGQIPASQVLKRWAARTVLVNRETGLL
jgi:hypothetical protein